MLLSLLLLLLLLLYSRFKHSVHNYQHTLRNNPEEQRPVCVTQSATFLTRP